MLLPAVAWHLQFHSLLAEVFLRMCRRGVKRLSCLADLTSIFASDTIYITLKEKWSHFDLKSWVTGGTKIWSGIPSYWRLFDSNWLDIESQVNSNWLDIESQIGLNWLDIESQFDSNILQLLGIPDRILIPPVTQLFRSKWLHFFFQ